MRQLRVTVPTYFGAAQYQGNIPADLPEFDAPNVPVLIHEAEGVRIVLGTHDLNDREKPDIQIERRPKGWAIFLHPVGGGDASGYVYFLDDGKSFLLPDDSAWTGTIEVLCSRKDPPGIDEIELPRPDVLAGSISMVVLNDRSCAKCRQMRAYSGDCYGDLCPECADAVDGDWVCRRCGRCGTFEAMGGDGASDPACCGVACDQLHPDDTAEESTPT